MTDDSNNEKIIVDNGNIIIKINNNSEIIVQLISLHTKESIDDMAKHIAETLYKYYRCDSRKNRE